MEKDKKIINFQSIRQQREMEESLKNSQHLISIDTNIFYVPTSEDFLVSTNVELVSSLLDNEDTLALIQLAAEEFTRIILDLLG